MICSVFFIAAIIIWKSVIANVSSRIRTGISAAVFVVSLFLFCYIGAWKLNGFLYLFLIGVCLFAVRFPKSNRNCSQAGTYSLQLILYLVGTIMTIFELYEIH